MVRRIKARDAFERFERRLRWRLALTVSSRRVIASLPAAVQITVGVIASYSFARFVLGHEVPLIAVTVVISVLGFLRDARPRRVLDSAIGILIGIIVSELLLIVVGRGVWQIGLVLLVTLLVARFASPNPGFAAVAGVQSMLVMLIPTPAGGPFVRSIDGLVGGAVALLVTALVPRDPRGITGRDAQNLVSTLTQGLGSLVEALVEHNVPAANLSVERLRKTQALVDNWAASSESAIAIARISPFLRRRLPDLRRQARILQGMDLASRHLRVIARRIYFLLREGGGRVELGALLGAVASALDLIAAGVEDASALERAGAELRELAPTLDPAVLIPDAPVSESVIVLLVRPLVVDLLEATGADPDEARALLPSL